MILITGHQGFIGTRLTKELDKLNIKWVGYDLLSDDNDIRDIQRLDRAFDTYQPDIVIHLAALAGARRGDTYPQDYFDTNVIGSENVARMCDKYGVKKLIAFSSSSAKTCQNTYGITKHTMELMLKKIKVPCVIVVRPFNVYGEDGRKDQVIWKWKALAEAGRPIEYHGDLKRNYTYVGDLVEEVIKMAHDESVGYHVLDLGCPKQTGLSELLAVFKDRYVTLRVTTKLMNDTPTTPDGTVTRHAWTDFITKAKELLE